MRLAIMQPYFFPYLGHFGLMAACDHWVVFDTCQYAPRTWMNRNRLLHPAGGWNWATVPLRTSSTGLRTWEAELTDPDAARRSLLGRMSHLRRLAPFHGAVTALIEEVFDGAGPSLVDLNVRGLTVVCRTIGLPFRHSVLSRLGLDLPAAMGSAAMGPGDWAPAICAALGATGYVNPAGGRALFDPAEFARRGIGLHFAQPRPFTYPTPGAAFVPDLSILDALLWNPPEVVGNAARACAGVSPA